MPASPAQVGCLDWCCHISQHLNISALHSLSFIAKVTPGKRELAENNVTFVVIDVWDGAESSGTACDRREEHEELQRQGKQISV